MGSSSWEVIENCIKLSDTELGSSKNWEKTMTSAAGLGILDASDPNNKFKDWNLAFL